MENAVAFWRKQGATIIPRIITSLGAGEIDRLAVIFRAPVGRDRFRPFVQPFGITSP